MATYAAFQSKEASEKILLAQVDAAKRLRGFVLNSGSVYRLDSFDFEKIITIKDSGTLYTEVASLAAVTAGTFFHDKTNEILYVQASDNSNPSSRFLVMTFRLFYSNNSIHLSNDLSTGFDVHWIPLVAGVSQFGTGLDQQEQIGIAIEGTGRLDLDADKEYWRTRFDKFTFENKRVAIYSYSRGLPATEAKLIFLGKTEDKTYSLTKVSFKLKDSLAELKGELALDLISEQAGAIIPSDFDDFRQRQVYGRVKGHVPTNVDHVIDNVGRVGPGTVSLTGGSTTMAGVATTFFATLNQNDEVIVDGTIRLAVETYSSDIAILMSTASPTTLSAKPYTVLPALPSRLFNRIFVIANHALREPITTVDAGITSNLFTVVDDTDLQAGDPLQIGTEFATIRRIFNKQVRLETNLLNVPSNGTTVTRITVSNVRLDDKALVLDRDYTYDASAGTMTLETLAEFNVAPTLTLLGTMTFTNTSRFVTAGVDTKFTSELKPGDWIRASNQSDFFEVGDITSDTTLTLKTAATYGEIAVAARYKTPKVYVEGTSKLSCDVMGKTENGTTTGVFIKTGPQIVEDILTQAGLGASLVSASFDTASDLAPYELQLVIPDKFNAKRLPKVRESIDRVNLSIFGSLIENQDFQLEYSVLSPKRQTTQTKVLERDLLSWSVKSRANRLVKTLNLSYDPRERDADTGNASEKVVTKEKDEAKFLSEASRKADIDTILSSASDAEIIADRFAFLRGQRSVMISMRSKMQFADLDVNDRVDFENRFLFEKKGSAIKTKVMTVQKSTRSQSETALELEDLSDALTRCGVITLDSAQDFDSSTDNELLNQGYITDDFGLIDNEEDTAEINLIW